MTYEIKQQILSLVLEKVPFNGWRQDHLRTSASELGISEALLHNVFPNGVIDLLEFYTFMGDQQMKTVLGSKDVQAPRIRDRVATAVQLRLEVQSNHMEATRQALAIIAMPAYAIRGTRMLYRTVDCIWYSIGDSSTDISFYTKRGLLAAVYASTLMFWLNDRSQDNSDTWSFLERRIDNVMHIQKIRGSLTPTGKYFPVPLRTLCAFATKAK